MPKNEKSVASRSLFYLGMEQQQILADKKTVARALGISIRTLTGLMATGRIPCIRLSPRLVRFDLSEVREAVGKHRTGGTAKSTQGGVIKVQ